MSAHPQRVHRHAVRPMQPVARPGKVGGVPIYVALEPVYKRMGYVEVSRYPYLVQMTPPAA